MSTFTKAQFDGLLNIIRENYDKTNGEIYLLFTRKNKISAKYARDALSEIIKTSKQLRRDLLALRKSMTKKRQTKGVPTINHG